eukprot:6744116-Prymnesium_polylepis.1
MGSRKPSESDGQSTSMELDERDCLTVGGGMEQFELCRRTGPEQRWLLLLLDLAFPVRLARANLAAVPAPTSQGGHRSAQGQG